MIYILIKQLNDQNESEHLREKLVLTSVDRYQYLFIESIELSNASLL